MALAQELCPFSKVAMHSKVSVAVGGTVGNLQGWTVKKTGYNDHVGGGRWAVGGGRWAVGGGRWAWAVGGGRRRWAGDGRWVAG